MSQLSTNEAIDYIQKLSKKSSTDSEVIVSEDENFSVSYQNQKIDKYELSNKKRLGVRAILNGREGLSFTESFSKEDLETCFRAAADNAKILEQNYTAELISNESTNEMPDLFNADLEKVPVEEKLELAKTLENETLAVDEKIKAVPYNTVGYYNNNFHVANTNGVNKNFSTNGIYSYAYALAQEQEDRGMDGHASITRNISKLNIAHVAKTAAEKALSRLGGEMPETGKYPVVLTSDSVQTFFERILGSFSAKAVDEKLSLFGDQLGQKIFSDQITITDDPFAPNTFSGAPFDSEGSASKKTSVVEKGVLKSFLTNSIYAKKMGFENTANASRGPSSSLGVSPTNFIINPGTQSQADLLKVYPRTILITRLKGLAGFNSLSGDFSVESEGFYYENGERVRPISNFVLSGSVLDLLRNVEAVGNEAYIFSSPVISPAFLISELSVAGKNS